ncbi:MAG: hypothetical protein GQ582_04670 [Methyloprofundus sp.]|nr:hypothetical protein [Methyloprofundus sp.]
MAEKYNSVSCSREGDIFHYRWAARRCLKLLDFNTSLDTVTIEGSNDDLAGELVGRSRYRGEKQPHPDNKSVSSLNATLTKLRIYPSK